MSPARKVAVPALASKFTVGQEVAVIGRGRVEKLDRVESIVRKTITIAGYRHTVFGLDGWEKRDRGSPVMGRSHIEVVTEAHRAELRRRDLWSKVDSLLGTHATWSERDECRARISTETLAKVVELLSPTEEPGT